MLLDPKLQLIKDLTISEGSLNASIVHPREVMIPAIRESAASFALIHNHPSGDPTLSQKDFEITHRLNQTGKLSGSICSIILSLGEMDFLVLLMKACCRIVPAKCKMLIIIFAQ